MLFNSCLLFLYGLVEQFKLGFRFLLLLLKHGELLFSEALAGEELLKPCLSPQSKRECFFVLTGQDQVGLVKPVVLILSSHDLILQRKNLADLLVNLVFKDCYLLFEFTRLVL